MAIRMAPFLGLDQNLIARAPDYAQAAAPAVITAMTNGGYNWSTVYCFVDHDGQVIPQEGTLQVRLPYGAEVITTAFFYLSRNDGFWHWCRAYDDLAWMNIQPAYIDDTLGNGYTYVTAHAYNHSFEQNMHCEMGVQWRPPASLLTSSPVKGARRTEAPTLD